MSSESRATDGGLLALEPRHVWRLFAELSAVPRCSRNEAAAMEWVEAVAARSGCEVARDAAGNRVVRVPATPGLTAAPTVVLQGHVDMVCEQDPGVGHDFGRDPIRPVVDGGWVRAQGTTLGADNGIGVAVALAFLEDPDPVHGPLELLFTVDEETGLTGARQLDPDLVRGRLLLNLDAEVLGRFTVGSAGGRDSHLCLAAPRAPWPEGEALRLTVSGLHGGHSGADIHRNRGNAIKLLARLLLSAASAGVVPRLATAAGGEKRNAIPRSASATMAVPPGLGAAFTRAVRAAEAVIRETLRGADDGLRIELEPLAGDPPAVAGPEETLRLLHLIDVLPSGLLAMSARFHAIVDTSSNVGVLRDDGRAFTLVCASRSARAAALEMTLAGLRSAARLAGAEISHSDGYAPWEPRLGTPLLGAVEQVYQRLFGETPSFELIHGGLECGLFLERCPDLDQIAYGARIEDAHSPSERVEIASVERLWVFTRALVAALAGAC